MDTATSTYHDQENLSLDAFLSDDGDRGHGVPLAGGPRLPAWLRSGAPTWIWAGLLVAAVGFVLITIAWGDVAGESLVYRQLPYLVSAGLSGLGLVLVGLTLINIGARQRDAIDRDRQVAQLVAILRELKAILEEDRLR
jgi:hypothetical protein